MGGPRAIDLRHVQVPSYLGRPALRGAEPRLGARRASRSATIALVHQALLTYASDISLLDNMVRPYGRIGRLGPLMTASLDHALWFHRDFRVDDWLLYVQESPAAAGARGFARGHDLHARGSARRLRRPGGPDAPGEPARGPLGLSAPAASAPGAPAERAEADWDLSAYFASLGDAGYLALPGRARGRRRRARGDARSPSAPLGDGEPRRLARRAAAPRGARGAARRTWAPTSAASPPPTPGTKARGARWRASRACAPRSRSATRAPAPPSPPPRTATFAGLLAEPALAASRHFLGAPARGGRAPHARRARGARRGPRGHRPRRLVAPLRPDVGHPRLRPRAARRGAAARAGLARAKPPRRRARRAAPGGARRREPRLGGAGATSRRLPERDRGHAPRALPAPRRPLPRAGPLRRRHHARHPRRDARRRSATRRELPRRYLRRKAALLGRARLGFQDLEAPLPAAPAERVSFDAARERVLAAFGRYHAGLGEFAARAFARRWIDWSPRPGKRPGGFCTTSPWILASRASSSPSAAPPATSRPSPTSSATPGTAS